MKDKININVGGISFTGALTILFIALKLLGIIDWSWIWVTAPLWIPIVIVFVVIILILVIYLISRLFKK